MRRANAPLRMWIIGLLDGVAVVLVTASEEGPELDQGEILPARRSPPLGLHRHAARPERPGLADSVDGSGEGADHSLREDPKRRQSLRSGVGTVPGSKDGLATGPNVAGRGRIEYLWKEQEGRCVVCGRPLRIAEEDCQIHHRILRTRGGQDTADNMELLHANCHRQIHVREGRTKATASREGRL